MNHQTMKISRLLLAVGMLLTVVACSTAPETQQGKDQIVTDSRSALQKAMRIDSSISSVIDRSAGYAVFPSIGKGAAGIGGAYGKGVLFQQGNAVGYCDLSQGSIGFQLGGQSYTQIIAFERQSEIDSFKRGDFELGAQATAVAAEAGAGANAQFVDGVAVYTMNESGLMFEASVGGQQFTYQPR